MIKFKVFEKGRRDGCEALWTSISAYADGEATEAEAVRVESHIAACSACERALEGIQGTTRSLLGTEEVEPPATLRSAILAATISPDAIHTARRPAFRPQWGFGAAAAAGALAALILHANQQSVELTTPVPASPKATAQRTPAVPAPFVTPAPPQNSPAVSAETRTASSGSPAGQVSIRTAAAPPVAASGKPPVERAHTLFPSVTRKPGTISRPPARLADNKPASSTGGSAAAPTTSVDAGPLTAEAEKVEPPVTKADVPIVPIPMEKPMVAAEPTPTAPGEPPARTIVLVAEAKSLAAGQVASLADLKKSLSQQKWNFAKPEALRGANGRVISLEIVKRSF